MLQISFLRDHKEEALQRLAIKNFTDTALVEKIISLDEERRKTQMELDNLLAQQNALAKQIGELFRSGKANDANDLKSKSTALKEDAKKKADVLQSAEREQKELIVKIP